MAINCYTREQIKFARVGYMTMNTRDLARAFNKKFKTRKTETAIQSLLSNHKITCGRKGNDRLINRRRLYSDEHERFVRENCAAISKKDLTGLFNDRFGLNMTLEKMKAFMANRHIDSGRTGYFPKGNKPWNEGAKGLVKPNSGNFKKGNAPPNRKPLGSERYDPRYGISIKVAERDPYTGFPTRYKLKHVYVWEQNFGPVPKGKIIAFIDGDNTNCEPKNLMAITRAELLTLNRNGYKKIPKELKPSVLVLSKLQARAHVRPSRILAR